MKSVMNYSKVFTTTYDPERLSLAKYTKADGSVFYIDLHCFRVREREFRCVLEIFLSTSLDKVLKESAQFERSSRGHTETRQIDNEMMLTALLIRSMIDFEGADYEACSLFFQMPQSLVKALYESVLHINMHMKK